MRRPVRKAPDQDLPENIQPGHYNKRRGEVLDKGVSKLDTQKDFIKEKFEDALQNPESAKKLFGKAYEKRINYIAARKAGISPDKFKKLPSEEQKQMVDNLTGDDLFDSLINNPPYKGEDIKVIANIAKIPEVNKATNLYDDLRNLDSDVVLSMQYEDEFLNFVGLYVNEKNVEESGGWFKAEYDKIENDGLDFLEFVEDIQTDWLDELC